MIDQEKLTKYEKSIQALIDRREMQDEVLVKAIQMESQLLNGLADNMKLYSEKYDFDGMKENIKLMKDSLTRLQDMLIEVYEKANDNQS